MINLFASMQVASMTGVFWDAMVLRLEPTMMTPGEAAGLVIQAQVTGV